MTTDNQLIQADALMQDAGLFYSGARPSERISSVLSVTYDPVGESSEDHRDRLFLQVLLSLAVNILALIVVFYFLLPLSESGRDSGGLLLWAVLGITAAIAAIFLRYGRRMVCVNLLLLMLGAVLFGASFFLGGVMSPTMIFLLAVPVLAGTLMHSRWAFFWTALTVLAWLLILVLENNGVAMTRITREGNVGVVQLVSLLGTVLVVMAVLGSYVSASARLRTAMQHRTERLDYLAKHDSLTSIPNRRTFFDHAVRCLQRSSRTGKPFALLVLDLNNFKHINDERGHKAGDAVLLQFAQRLVTGFRSTDFIGRIGGDEFGVLLEPLDSTDGVEQVMERFRNSGSNEVQLDNRPVVYEFAVGVAIYPDNGESISALYEAADVAMYSSKNGMPAQHLWK